MNVVCLGFAKQAVTGGASKSDFKKQIFSSQFENLSFFLSAQNLYWES